MLGMSELLFEWDETKSLENLRKHRVSFPEAKTIFNDPLLVSFPDDEHSDDEERLISIGLSARNRILLAVHTERGYEGNALVIRLISCRRATSRERKVYEGYEI